MFSKKQPTQYATSQYADRDAEPYFPPIGTTLPQPYYQGSQYGQPQAAVAAAPAAEPHKVRQFFKRLLIVLVIIGMLVGGYIGAKFLLNASKAFEGSLFGLLQNNELRGEDSGRVNILLAGNSADDPGHGGADLTDSIMLVSIDTRHDRAFMMSIPRDLYVEVPGRDEYSKINAIYAFGKEDNFSETGYAEGGMGALQKVLSANLGIDIHYYALVNYTAFRDSVNAVGGIDVVINSEDKRGLYDAMIAKADGGPLRLSNGPQHLDGQTALNLARARGSGYSYGFPRSDFNRSENQRMMLVALKQKTISAGVLSNPVKVGNLLDSIGDNVQTDIKTNEIRRLYDISKKIPDNKIQSFGLNNAEGKNLLKSYSARGGQSALVPAAGLDDYSDIQAFLEEITAPPPAADGQGSSQP